MKIYIAGPMTGLPAHNYPAFHEAANALTKKGHVAFNPAGNFSGRLDLPTEVYMRLDIAMLLQVDAVLFLPGWLQSSGAKLEFDIAVALKLPRYYLIESIPEARP